ncbi:MAG: T9SS type A sorting domain-containing protein [Candidatus Eisenbacteria bacterium]|nr:T9SS type A sorting domain-containing protein [Candidatus Eisenbacteria bacterium]
MKQRFVVSAVFVLGLTALFASAALAGRPSTPDWRTPGLDGGRNCATPEPTVFETEAVQAALRRYIEDGRAGATGQIKIAWHVIYNGSTGNIPQSQIDAQIAYMNARYAGTGFSFVLASVDRTNKKAWWTMTPGSRAEKNAKNTLAIDPLHRFNVYTCKPGQSLLGWATFPWSYAENNKQHGVVIHYGSVPGGYLAPYNLGGTLAHEAGHYLGLYHTFQGGCTAPGDYCDDTPYEASAASGCPEGRNTCSSAGLDPIHNYMDYSDDACYTEFTSQQISRMQSMTGQYRPNLLNAPIAQAGQEPTVAEPMLTGGVAFRNVFPNPFKTNATVQLYLPRSGQVTVKVYNVAGQLVETLADGDMSAGDHSLVFAPKLLAPGTYFIHAVTAGSRTARTVVLLR